MTPAIGLSIIVGLGLLGAIGAAIKAFLDRRGLSAKADSDEATATAVLAAAARELVDPLRKELALEREEHAAEVARMRQQAHALSRDLTECQGQVTQLRKSVESAWAENERLRNRIIELELFHGGAD